MPLAANPLIEVVPGLMIWTLICFGITFFVLRRYAFGPIQKIIDERRERIRESLEEAEHAREESRKLLEEHRQLRAGARGEAEEILSEARRVAELDARARPRGDRGRPAAAARGDAAADRGRDHACARADPRRGRRARARSPPRRSRGKAPSDRDDHRRLIDEAIEDLDFSALEKAER